MIVLVLCLFCTPYLRYRYNRLVELSIRSYFNFIHKISILFRSLRGLTKLGIYHGKLNGRLASQIAELLRLRILGNEGILTLFT